MSGNLFLIRYKWKTGMLAWLLHRLTGLGLIFYLSLHVFVTRAFHDAAVIPDAVMRTQRFAEIYGLLTNPLFGLLEIALVGAVLYHALNGIRVLIIDFGDGARYHKRLWCGMMAIFVILMLILGGMMALHVFHWGGAA